jgi:hypothetical protein
MASSAAASSQSRDVLRSGAVVPTVLMLGTIATTGDNVARIPGALGSHRQPGDHRVEGEADVLSCGTVDGVTDTHAQHHNHSRPEAGDRDRRSGDVYPPSP